MNELALFAGAGGGILGGKLLGWRTICAVELDPYARGVLIARQNDGTLAPFPVWDDISTFDGKPWRGAVDVVSGGFPCQDISCAGKGAGIDGERSGLWREMFRVVREVGPRFVFVENSPMLTSRGLGRVLGDLASIGFDVEWVVLGADDAEAPHRRKRIWILGHSTSSGLSVWTRGAMGQSESIKEFERSGCKVAHPNGPGLPLPGRSSEARGANEGTSATSVRGDWWETEPALGRVAHGVANRVDRLRAIGNGQVPAVAALAWETLIRRIEA